MARRTWVDRIVERPKTYTVQENADGTITLVPSPGAIIQEGTPVNAANLNGLEDDVEAVTNSLTTHEGDNTAHGLSNLIQIDTGVTLLSTSWVDDTATSGYWIYDVTDAEVNANTIVDVNVHLSSLEAASSLKPVTQSFAGYYRLYAEEQPTADITVDVRKTRQVV